MTKELSTDILVLVPVFNDWESVGLLLPRLDEALATVRRPARVLLVNDGSTDEPPADLLSTRWPHLDGLHLLELCRNLGHQRALCIAMAWLHDHFDFQALVVMDGDGEDNPADVPRLVETYFRENGKALVFAERTRRSESRLFKVFYQLYKMLHVLLTGRHVKVGNFSAISPRALDALVVTPELWNHYAAATVKTRLPLVTVPSPRNPRYQGASRMNFAALAVHGLAALSTYSEVIGVRLLMSSLALAALAGAGLAALIALRLFARTAMPVWSPYGVGLLVVALLQVVALAISFILIILAGRQTTPFVPIREYRYFVRGWLSSAAGG